MANEITKCPMCGTKLKIFERHFEKDLQNEGMIWAALRIEWDQ